MSEFQVECILTIIGFVVSIFIMKKEFKNSLKDKNDTERIKLYSDWYCALNQLESNDNIIYSKNFISKVEQMKAEVYLFATSNVIKKFDEIFKYINEIYNDFSKYYLDNDPENDKCNYIYDIDSSGSEYSIYSPTQNVIEDFENKIEIYKDEHKCDKEKINKLLLNLLNEMRKDLGNNKIKQK